MAALVKHITNYGKSKVDPVDCSHIEIDDQGIRKNQSESDMCIMKTHLPYALLPQCVHDGKAKVWINV